MLQAAVYRRAPAARSVVSDAGTPRPAAPRTAATPPLRNGLVTTAHDEPIVNGTAVRCLETGIGYV